MNLDYNSLSSLKGDASYRKFFRKKYLNKTSIIIFCKKEKFKNLVVYESINRILIKNKISAPKLINQNLKNNFIEIEDLGKNTIYEEFVKKKTDQKKIYKKIVKMLIKLQKIKTKKIKNLSLENYFVPIYNKKILTDEASLFLKWCVPEFYKGKKKKIINDLLKKNIKQAIEHLKLPNNTFVHRDFHVSNLIYNKNKISIIDSQDSLYGNPSYDLASLVDDVRFQTDMKTKNFIFDYFILNQKTKIDIENFKNDFQILSVLRNMKIIGIFIKLSKRDNKKKYLKLIPRAWRLINLRIKDNKNLTNLKKILQIYFPKKL